ncbi:sugar ABC transporter ATP-binding protein [Sphaerisporangium album]|uniref:Sugar ABC transporter ATP-binding protein n=1 Tax=Sphaerisporangium album TaxID=509200 RepID=A0A367FPR6_9ACTN|nr:sugar ABC transporter ATP-binding protein [Sphaerisporangium album]RCG31822.1 sugar ABC transporter ATP-binding protein [Sphaerisporangium album]
MTTTMEIRGVRKRFGNTQALAGVDLTLRGGEILGIAGPNGAGKSTLTKILCGEESMDSGEILVDGRPWKPGDVSDPIAIVHQEPQVWTNLTLEENLLVGNEGAWWRAPVAGDEQRRVLESLGVAHLADQPLERCTLAVRQRAEIARALVRSARFFLFDEPNSALTDEESHALFAFMHGLADQGYIVVFISHRLSEMVAHCHRVVVIRDGVLAATLTGDALTEPAIAVELVAGQTPRTERRVASRAADGDDSARVLTVTGWTDEPGSFRPLDLELRRGDVLAVVGVEGSGGRELVATLGGHRPATGDARLNGGQGAKALRERTSYLSADRQEMLFQHMSVGDNLVLRLGRREICGPFARLRRREIRSRSERMIERYAVRTSGPDQNLSALSGGNQQKVAIASAMATMPEVLVIEEPTRGVDIGSKAEIYTMLNEFAADGRAVVVFCTEAPEVFEVANRVMVLEGGRIVQELAVGDYDTVDAFAHALALLEGVETTQDRPANGRATLAGPSDSTEESS